MMQNYGIVTPGNSSAMVIFFRTAFLNFYFRPNGLNDAPFVIFFAVKKYYGSCNQLLCKYNPS